MQFLPLFNRWVSWRCKVWEHALLLLPKQTPDGGEPEVGDDVRKLLMLEDCANDQEAYIRVRSLSGCLAVWLPY